MTSAPPRSLVVLCRFPAVARLAYAGRARIGTAERQARPGGQIYRQPLPPAEVAVGQRATPEVAGDQALLAAAREAGVEFRGGSTVWGIFDERTLAVALADFYGDPGPATSAQLNFPVAVAIDTAGNLFIVET